MLIVKRVRVRQLESGFDVQLSDLPTARVVRDLDLVVDCDSFGDLVAIEVLGLKRYAGASVLDPHDAPKPEGELVDARITYDPEVDGFYLKVSSPSGARRPLRSQPGRGVIELDESGRITRLMGLL